MKSEVPKQFLLLNNYPVLYYSLKLFFEHSSETEIILVLPEKHLKQWDTLVSDYSIQIPHTVVSGGPTRFHSVKSGLRACSQFEGDHVIAVHDGVRPLVKNEVLQQGFYIASKKGSAIPVIAVNETMREVCGSLSRIVPREHFCLVQTPQFFRYLELKDCYTIQYSEAFNDDAGVYEASGRQVTLIDGNPENIKITNPSDIAMASVLLHNFIR